MKNLESAKNKACEIALNRLARKVHTLAREKHWHDQDERDDAAFVTRTVANLHGEVSEMWEAFRNGNLWEPCDKWQKMEAAGTPQMTCIEEELADIIIRALDSAQRLGVNIGEAVLAKHAFNETRPDRHGGKLA